MNVMLKKMVSILLAIVFIMSAIPLAAYTVHAEGDGNSVFPEEKYGEEEKGTLTLEKEYPDWSGEKPDVTVDILDENGDVYETVAVLGDGTPIEVELPLDGTYMIEEQVPDGFFAVYDNPNKSNATQEQEQIVTFNEDGLCFIDIYNYSQDGEGVLSLIKDYPDSSGEKPDVTVDIFDGNGDVYETVTVLGDGSELRVTLPLNETYTIQERVPDGYTAEYHHYSLALDATQEEHQTVHFNHPGDVTVESWIDIINYEEEKGTLTLFKDYPNWSGEKPDVTVDIFDENGDVYETVTVPGDGTDLEVELPLNETYTIQERVPDGYRAEYYHWGVASNATEEEHRTVHFNQQGDVTVESWIDISNYEEEKGTLTLEKYYSNWPGPGNPPDVDIDILDENGDVYQTVTVPGDGTPIEVELPLDETYMIEEQVPAGFFDVYDNPNKNDIVTQEEDQTVTFNEDGECTIDIYNYSQDGEGVLSLIKDYPDSSGEKPDVTVDIFDGNGDVYETVTVLGDGSELRVTLPLNETYTIQERVPDGYRAEYYHWGVASNATPEEHRTVHFNQPGDVTVESWIDILNYKVTTPATTYVDVTKTFVDVPSGVSIPSSVEVQFVPDNALLGIKTVTIDTSSGLGGSSVELVKDEWYTMSENVSGSWDVTYKYNGTVVGDGRFVVTPTSTSSGVYVDIENAYDNPPPPSEGGGSSGGGGGPDVFTNIGDDEPPLAPPTEPEEPKPSESSEELVEIVPEEVPLAPLPETGKIGYGVYFAIAAVLLVSGLLIRKYGK